MRLLTLICIALAAYLAADLAHEALGHGGACLALGGHVLLLDTTFEDCSIKSRLIDGAGPVMGIAVALFAWLGARMTRARTPRLFLVLLFAFAAFWNVGYLIKSGLMHNGDWHFVIADLEPVAAWHIALAIAGVALYIAAMRMLVRVWPTGEGMRSSAFALTAYVAAAALSAAGGAFNPKGHAAILTDALPSALASLGLVLVGMRRTGCVAVPVSLSWIGAGLLSAVFFVAVLGPGIRF
jgi:hypothetical protein